MDAVAKFSAELAAEGFQGDQVLLGAMAELLVHNQFTGISNLVHADPPREWDGAAEVAAEGLAFLDQVRKRMKRGVRSRCAFRRVCS